MFTSSRVLLCLVAFVSALAVLAPVASADTLDVTQVVLVYTRYYVDGVAQDIWSFSTDVAGTGMTGLTVTKPDLSTFSPPAHSDGSGYGLFDAPFSSLSNLEAAYPTGTYGFDVNGGALAFSLNLSATAPGGICTNLSPANLSTGVPLVPTFSWTSVSPSQAIGLHAQLDNGGQWAADVATISSSSVMSVLSTNWSPGVTLNPGTEYSFQVGAYQGSFGTLTVNGDTFDTAAVYGFSNVSNFTTTSAPEPATLSLLALGGLALLRKRRLAA